MKNLIQGIHHFQNNTFTTKRELFERLAKGQTPDALFITCSDSRINPNLITHTEPGELFIIRNAGNIVPPYGAPVGGEAATIEYAITALKIKDIIICGHTQCGAVSGLLNPDALKVMPSVVEWLAHSESTRRIVMNNYPDATPEEQINLAIQENVLVQIENLRTLPVVADALACGELGIHGWVYKIETGEVFAFDPGKGQFHPILKESVPTATPKRVTALESI